MQHVAAQAPPVIVDRDGVAIDQSVPLSVAAYVELEGYAQFPHRAPAQGEEGQRQIKVRALELVHLHDAARERNPQNARGVDLNNFYAINESVPGWLKESFAPKDLWALESGIGYSEKYLQEPLKLFARNIRDAFEVHGIDPVDLQKRVWAATTDFDHQAICWRELRTIYIHLRLLGYADKELVQ